MQMNCSSSYDLLILLNMMLKIHSNLPVRASSQWCVIFHCMSILNLFIHPIIVGHLQFAITNRTVLEIHAHVSWRTYAGIPIRYIVLDYRAIFQSVPTDSKVMVSL